MYSLHEPAVYAVSQGNERKPYEYGCRVSLAVTHKQGWALSVQALATNQYDGHSLSSSLSRAESLSERTIKQVYVDKGYKGHGIVDKAVYHPGKRKIKSRSLQQAIKPRCAIEPLIGHMKNDGKLGVNYLKGVLGDQLNALLCAIGHNLRMLLAFNLSYGGSNNEQSS